MGQVDREINHRINEQKRLAEPLARKLNELDTEQEKLLRAYYADAISLDQLKKGQDRITGEGAQLERQLSLDEDHYEAVRRLIRFALNLACNLGHSYAPLDARDRQRLKQAVLAKVATMSGQVVSAVLEWPFGFMPEDEFESFNKNRRVDLIGHYLNSILKRNTAELQEKATEIEGLSQLQA